ncbi:MAG: hypothetical protein FJ100_09900 [Deltaproteobacteria bacterium]|nr:hypothetical protein [Deltaproteobacteria bacterium]
MATKPAAPAARAAKSEGEAKGFPRVFDEKVLAAELATGRIRPVYVVSSADVPNRDRYADRPYADPQALLGTARRIEAVALQRGDPALDYVKLDYLDGDFEAQGMNALIAAQLRAQSLFGGRRVVTVVHADAMALGEGKPKGRSKAAKAAADAKGPQDPLERALLAVDPDDRDPAFVLIVVAQAVSPTGGAWEALARAGVVVLIAPLTVQALQAYLAETGAPHGIRIAAGVAQKVWDRLGGSDPARLRSTADRLILDAGPGGTVTTATVEDNVPVDREAAVWAVTDAIERRDVARAMTVLHLLLEPGGDGESDAIRTLGALASQYTQLAAATALVRKGATVMDLVRSVGVSPGRAEALVRQARTVNPSRTHHALRVLAQLDRMLKSSQLGEKRQVALRYTEQAVLAIVRGGDFHAPGPSTALQAL